MTVPLSLFSGLVTELSVPDIPEGLSPDNQDVVFLPGSVGSRPGLHKVYATAISGNVTVVYQKTYVQPNGNPINLLLDSAGNLWKEDVTNAPGTLSLVATVTSGATIGLSCSAFGREYLAISDGITGAGAPLQFDGTNLDRVTQDGPGRGPSISDDTTSYSIVASPTGLVTFASTSITSITEAGNLVTLIFTDTSVPPLVVGDSIQIAGVTPSGYNGTFVITYVLREGSTFTVRFNNTNTGLAAGTGGTVAFNLVTVATTAANVFIAGQSVTISGVAVTGYNGTWIVRKILDSFTLIVVISSFALAASGGGTIAAAGSITAGTHGAVVMFLTRQGYLTKPSPATYWTSAGSTRAAISNLPIGPPNVVARVLAFTGAGGGNYFSILANLTLPQPNSFPITVQATIVPDNTSTSAFMDFSDNALFGANGIDIPGNNLFAQVVISPCTGFFGYASRLFTWGEYNKVQNLLNMGFEGGYAPPSGFINLTNGSAAGSLDTGFTTDSHWAGQQIWIDGTFYTILSIDSSTTLTLTSTYAGTTALHPYYVVSPYEASPDGWDYSTSGSASGGTLVPNADYVLQSGAFNGFGWQITGDGTANTKGLIAQSFYQDNLGIAIAEPNTKYSFRCWAKSSSNALAAGSLIARINSASQGVLATATIAATGIKTAGKYFSADFSAAMPSTIPSDARLQIYCTNLANNATVTIDEMLIYPTVQPYLNNRGRGSYVNGPEQFDGVTGVIGPATDTSPLRCFFEFRDVMYMDTSRGRHETIDNATGEPSTWSVRELSQAVGALSLKSSDTGITGTGDSGEQFEFTASRSGAYIFWGGEMVKVSQEIQTLWESINFAAKQTVWVKNDPVARRCYFGVPLNGATAPNTVLVLDYRELNTPEAIASTAPFRQSYSGRMISSEICRKWTKWSIQANSCEILTLPNSVQALTFGSGNGQTPGAANGFGNIYYLDAAKLTDDDYGQIVPYWTTYFFVSNDQEQALQLDSHRKLATYFTSFMTGTGQTSITPLSDTLANAYTPLSQYPLSASQSHDYEWNINVDGERIAMKIGSVPLSGQTDNAFNLQKLALTLKKHPWSPVRGSI